MSAPNQRAEPRSPPLNTTYTITVITDDLIQPPNSSATRISDVAATYHGAAYAWLQQLGHRKTVHFAIGESYETRLNRSFSHVIGNKPPLWTLLILDPTKTFVNGFLPPGDWNHMHLHEEAAESRAVVLYLRFDDGVHNLQDCLQSLELAARRLEEPENFVMTIYVSYSGRHIGGAVRPPVITVLVNSYTYNAIWKAVTESYPYQLFVGRAPACAVRCVGFNHGDVFFSCQRTMAVAMDGAIDRYTLEVVLVDVE